MNSKGFFSIFVTAFAVIFLISLFYAQSLHFEIQTRDAELGTLHQALSKDWFLARNALANFASDAILHKISVTDPLPKNSYCGIDFDPHYNSTFDYGPDINAYWDTAIAYMNTNFGTNCDANLSGDIERQMEGPSASEAVRTGERAYGLLSCTRSTAHSTQTLTRPFVIRKEVRNIYLPNIECEVNVFDMLGNNPAEGINFEKLDVNRVFT
jgi:hypothetical protein